MTIVRHVPSRRITWAATGLIAVLVYACAAPASAQLQAQAAGSADMETLPCLSETPASLAASTAPACSESGVSLDPTQSRDGQISTMGVTDEQGTCDPYSYLGKWATTGPVASFVLDNQNYWTTYGGYSGYATNVLNYCTGYTASSRTSTSPGSWPFCYYCNLVVDLLDHVYQCGYYQIRGWGYTCNDRFNGDLYKNFLDQGYQYVATGVWYKVAPAIAVTATDTSNGWVTNVTPGAATTFTVPVYDRPYSGHNSPIKVYNIAIFSAVATNIKIETFYDGTEAGHAHGGRPLKDYDLTGANQLGALFGGPNRTGGLVGTVMSFRLNAGQTRTISYQTTGFAGTETVRFTYNDNLPQFRASNDWRIEAQVNYLEELEDSPWWVKYGTLPAHPRSYYGTGPFNNFVRRFAYWYYHWTGGGNGGNPERFRYNDMSLVKGGPFDILGLWNNSSGHQKHREGLSLDLDEAACRPWYSDYDCQTRDRASQALKPLDGWVALAAWDEAKAENPDVIFPTYDYEDGLYHYHIQAN